MLRNRQLYRSGIIALLLPLLVAAEAQEVASREGANLQRPSWSADGGKLAYEANFHDDKRIELYVGDPVGGTFRRVTPNVRSTSSITEGFSRLGNGGEVAHELCWAPPPYDRFAYSAADESQDYEIFLGGGGPLTDVPGADGGPAWSPDGRFIAFTSSRTGEGDLYLLDMGHHDQPPRRVTSFMDSSELYVAWSPDSTQLAFVGHSDSGDNVWLIPSLGDDPVQLTNWTGNQTRPTFSPKGEWIAFYANLEDMDRLDLYLVEPRVGAVPRLLTRAVVPNAGGPSWTPDGRHLVLVLDDDQRFDPLAVLEARPGAEPKIIDLGTVGHGDLDVVEGPEGTLRLAYVAQGRGRDDIRDYKRLFVSQLPPIQ